MPRYNLNQEDIEILTNSLEFSIPNLSSESERSRYKRLKNRLLHKLTSEKDDSSSNDGIDVWGAFQGGSK